MASNTIGGITITDSNYTHILAIVDRSGSMGIGGVDREMANALNVFFKEQAKLDGVCLVDYVQFDTEYEKVFEDTLVSEAKAVISPRGGTALVDAIGLGTVELGDKLASLPEHTRPGRVMVVVVTDGMENCSIEYTAEQVRELVSTQQDKYDWDYVFLGANIDAVSTGQAFGFKGSKSMTFDTANAGATMDSLNAYTTAYRGAGGAAAAFSDEDRKNALGKA